MCPIRKDTAKLTVELAVTVNQTRGDSFDLTISPTVLHVIPGDTIIFKSNGDAFTVIAKGSSPLNKADIRGIKGEEVEAIVETAAARGAYLFACAVYKDGKIYMDANCPPIIIDPGTHN